jgi:mRNA interferase RelE/StbE
MTWQINFNKTAARQFAKLDKQIKQRIIDFLEYRIAPLDNPKQIGKALQGELSEYWTYRVGDYRILTKHENNQFIILVIEVGYRKEVYK